MLEFAVERADVLDVPSDLLLLKYAQHFYGADRTVANRLVSAGLCREVQIRPLPWDFAVVKTRGAFAPERVMFLGTPPLHEFAYDKMELFAYRAIEKIVSLKQQVRVISTTVHGTGYGLDAGEALQRLIMGFQRGLSQHREASVESITFLTLEQREERMLNAALKAYSKPEAPSEDFPTDEAGVVRESQGGYTAGTGVPAGRDVPTQSGSSPGQSVPKRRVFVAMPFSEEFENVYEFGIYPAVRNCGLICEKVDESHFTGDILERIREGIASADFVIADLTEGRPNVYLEVGYAWGKGVPVIFVARKGEDLHFDVRSHRCVYYGGFSRFAKDLEELIRGIWDPGQG